MSSQEGICEYSRLVKQGYLKLYNSSSYFSQWKTKWIVLKGFCVLVFNEPPVDHKSNDVLHIFDLSVYDESQAISNDGDRKHILHLYSSASRSKSSMDAKFRSNSKEELMQWIDCIQKQQHKICINERINQENEPTVLCSISQLIDDGCTSNQTETALKLSVMNEKELDTDDSDDDEAPFIASFDPRAMFQASKQDTSASSSSVPSTKRDARVQAFEMQSISTERV